MFSNIASRDERYNIMNILSGTTVRDALLETLREKISLLSQPLTLAIFQVGQNDASAAYIGQKKKMGASLGIAVEHILLDEHVSEEEFLQHIERRNADRAVTGIIVQLPLPPRLNRRKILDAIAPGKDVDGLGSVQSARLYLGDPSAIAPATARGIMSLCEYYTIGLEGRHVVVVGRSDLVGKPTALLALQHNATVTVCHSRTQNLPEITRTADILIAACGIPRHIGADHVRAGQVVIDVGIHKTEQGICGDVDFDAVKDSVSAITPVPGGVGPLTVISLFQNVVDASGNV